MDQRTPWSRRRWWTVGGLALGVGAGLLGMVALPGEWAAVAGSVTAVLGLLLGAVVVVFLVVPGPGTPGYLARSVPLAGAVLVVAVLLLLSTDADLRLLWLLIAVVAAGWTAAAWWQTRRSDG